MGQTVSNYKKNFDSTVFGYTTATSVYIKIDKTDDEDNVLFRPFLYGLSAFPTSTASSINDNKPSNRADSGFLLCEKDSQLWKDLLYVDQIYYSNTLKPKKQEKSNLALGNPMTFNDIQYTSTQDLHLSRRGFGSISPNIGLLSMIRKLDLSFNQLTEIPQEIGHLNQLESLSLSHNKITHIPDTICHLTQLIDLNMSYNLIHRLTPFISHLKNLKSLQLDYNRLSHLTVCIEKLHNLNTLDLSHNPIHILPAEITQLPFLRRLRLEGCPFVNSFDQQVQLAHNPPSLLESCARIILKNEDQIVQLLQKKQHSRRQFRKRANMIDFLKNYLTEPLFQYLSSSKTCSFCHGPYFDSYISRGRWIERNETWVPLEYRLCSAHWSDEEDRIYAMFSCSPPNKTALQKSESLFKSRPELPVLNSLISPTSKTRKLQIHRHYRRSSISLENDTPYTVTNSVQLTTANSASSSTATINTNGQEQASESPLSTIKRWKFKVRNNSSFLKKHRLS